MKEKILNQHNKVKHTLIKMDPELKKARIEARSLEPLIRIGKNGLTESIINETIKLLKKKKIVIHNILIMTILMCEV